MHRRASALVAATLLVLTAACGGEEATQTDPPIVPTPIQSTSPVPADGAATEDDATESAGNGEAITVTGVDYAFEGLPSEIAAGTRVTFTNGSDVEAHELVLVQLPDGEDRPVEELLESFEPTGEPALVSVAGPGQEGEVFVGDGTITEPGRYLAVCFLPVGADPEAILNGDGPTESDAPPHAAEGMVAEVVVS